MLNCTPCEFLRSHGRDAAAAALLSYTADDEKFSSIRHQMQIQNWKLYRSSSELPCSG
jgi:predicted RNase H-like nuclease (RuvC/YqgF family)